MSKNKDLRPEKIKNTPIIETFGDWFDNLFPSSGLCDYRPIYTVTHPQVIVKYIYYEIKYAYQRVFRGWDDRVVWSISTHLNENMPLWLEELKQSKGTPCFFYSNVENASKEEDELARNKWLFELDKMILGFVSAKKMENTWTENPELEKNFKEGMESFTKYYFNLWD